MLGFGGNFFGGFEINGEVKISKLSLYGVNKKIDLNVNGGWKDYGNYWSGLGMDIFLVFINYDYSIKLGFNLDID